MFLKIKDLSIATCFHECAVNVATALQTCARNDRRSFNYRRADWDLDGR